MSRECAVRLSASCTAQTRVAFCLRLFLFNNLSAHLCRSVLCWRESHFVCIYF